MSLRALWGKHLKVLTVFNHVPEMVQPPGKCAVISTNRELRDFDLLGKNMAEPKCPLQTGSLKCHHVAE